MRKIELAMIEAINTLRHNRANASWSQANTTVTNHVTSGGNATEIFLHGNHIATISETPSLHISLAGWNTRTTRSRLTRLIGHMARLGRWPDGSGVSTARGRVFLHDAHGKREIDADGWHTVNLDGG
jgi:hypothetical protein